MEEEKRRQEEELRFAEEEAELCERDKRTVFVYHLHPRVDSKVLSDFFSKAGKVRDVRLITDKKTGKSKGYAFDISRVLVFVRNTLKAEVRVCALFYPH